VASRLFVKKTLFEAGVGIDSAVAQEGPIAANVFQMREIHFAVQDFFAVGGSFRDDDSLGIAKE
jgi:hypothetical protein